MLAKLEAYDRSARPQRAARVVRNPVSDAIIEACGGHSNLGSPARSRVKELMTASAWTDAVLALIESELPEWSLRRLAYDGVEWHCALSRHCAIPAEFDETADGSHELRPLAIVKAFLEARRINARADRPRPIQAQRADVYHAVLCDNFA